MPTRDDDQGRRGTAGQVTGLPTVPALPRESPLWAPDDPSPELAGDVEELSFDLRFEAGQTLLALREREVEPGVTVARALFEVPDVEYPLNVSRGPQQFKNRRLTLRAIELVLSHASLFVVDRLKAAGFTLARERSRTGGLELLFDMQGPAGPIPMRARGIFAPAGEAGLALVLHEILSFTSPPRPRAEIAEVLLDALHLPGASPSRAMVRRADPFRASLARLLPRHGWKLPAMGAVRVQEVVLGRGEVTIRAWSRDLPEGWKPPRDVKRGPLEDAVALAVFADGLVSAGDETARLALIDRLIDQVTASGGALSPSIVPFAAEALRRDGRRRTEGNDLVRQTLERSPEHLGCLSAHVEEDGIAPLERAARLAALGRAADAADEPWVAARAFIGAAELARHHGDAAYALECAEAAFLADPSVPETGVLTARLLAEAGSERRALTVGRTALERFEDAGAVEDFAVWLAGVARIVEGVDAARVLLRRALRRADRRDALMALVDVEVEAGAFERAAELLTRLLMLMDRVAPGGAGDVARIDVEILAARLAEARGDRDGARLHLSRAREIQPSHPVVALRIATILETDQKVDRALDVLAPATAALDAPAAPLVLAARLFMKRRAAGDPDRARALLERVPHNERSPSVRRLDAEVRAALGSPDALAEILMEEAEDTAEGARTLLHAASLFLDAGRVHDAAAAIVRALPFEPAGSAELVAEDGSGRALIRALAARTAKLPVALLLPLATRLADTGRPRDAHGLLAARGDRASVELRMAYAAAAGETALEIAEIERLLPLVDEGLPQMAPLLRRLASLHMLPGGRGPLVAADTWEHAAAAGDLDLERWLEAALASDDEARLAAFVRHPRAEVLGIDSAPLRKALRGLSALEDAPVRLHAAAVLAARGESIDDVEAWLEAARGLTPAEAAHAFAEAATAYGRVPWLLEAAHILQQAGDAPGALRILHVAGEPMASEISVARATFSVAIETGEAGPMESAADALLRREDLDDNERADVHARRTHALALLDAERGRVALERWLDEQPRAEQALELLIPYLLKHGELSGALERLDRACRARGDGLVASLPSLLEKTAAAAQRRGEVALEIRARELLLGVGPDGRVETAGADGVRARAALLERLADLYGETGRVQSAVDVLLARVALGGESEHLAALLLRVAALQEDELGERAAAADALRGRLRYAPDDASTSRRLQTLLTELGDDDALLQECVRRAARLEPSQERNELWIRAGDCAQRLGRPDEAVAMWLRALRAAPYAADALKRLLDLAREARRPRLAVRARLAAARTLGEGTAAAEQAGEAGAQLYGILGRARLAVAAFRFAENQDRRPARHTRVLVDLHRTLGDGTAALAAVDRLLAASSGQGAGLFHEVRAEILDDLLGTPEAAAAARREALRLDPTQRTAARSLARHLRDSGDPRAALEVDRAWADAALEGPARASAYAVLAARAEEELLDPALAAQLSATSLSLARDADVLRRRVRALTATGAAAEAVEALEELLAEQLPLDERMSLTRQKAALEENDLGRKSAARRTLQRALGLDALAQRAGSDVLFASVARLEEALEEHAAAVGHLQRALTIYPQGSPALGTRGEVLERAAALLDAAPPGERDAARVLALLDDAAAAGELGWGAELRRARVAEELGRADVALEALGRLLAMGPAAEERGSLLGRKAVAAERLGRFDVALSAWQQRTQSIVDDTDAWQAVERLARTLGRAPTARAAADALLRLEAGSDDERFARLVACARDSRDRLQDAAGAWALLSRARELRDDPALRREALAVAEAAGDAAAALGLLDVMNALGDPLPPRELARRAELRIESGDQDRQAFDDLLRALDDGGLIEGALGARLRALLGRVAARAPQLVVEALLARTSPEPTDAAVELRALLDADRLADPATPSTLLSALADARPTDGIVVLAAAAREQEGRNGTRAADRLWLLAEKIDGSESIKAKIRSRAAEALLLGSADGEAVLARIERLRPSIADRPDLRNQALTLLRDMEAWDAIAALLEDALASAPAAERRLLRLELVSVLRDGLGEESRAASHLQALVEEDPEDREAWGELLECLDALAHNANGRLRLADALGRRAALAAGIERRELVRRRATILVELGHGQACLEQLIAVRADARGDAQLKTLEKRIHQQSGAAALAAFLTAELARSPDALDAEQLLALDPEVAGLAARIEAHIVLADDVERARDRATGVLTAPCSSEQRISEAVALTERLTGPRREAFLGGLARRAHVLGSQGALALADALAALQPEGAARAFGAATARRRWRVEGAARVKNDVELLRFAASTKDETSTAEAVAFALAARLGDMAELGRAAAALRLSGQAADAWEQALATRSGEPAKAELERRAAQALLLAARAPSGAVACARLGDTMRGVRRLQALDGPNARRAASRARRLRPTPERLPLRLAFVAALAPDDARAERELVAATGMRAGRWEEVAATLDELLRGGVDAAREPRLVADRAEAAWRLSAADAVDWATRAADTLERSPSTRDRALLHRRRAVEGLLRRRAGDRDDALRAAIVSLAQAAPDDTAVQSEALGVAQAAGLADIVDNLLARAAERAASGTARFEVISRRAAYRLDSLRDAQGAFQLLMEGVRAGEPAARESAWTLATREGLVDAQIEVVDDDLARAALLALSGRSRAAVEIAERLDSPAAWLLIAEVSAWEGDLAGEARALENLGAFETSDPSIQSLLIGLDRRRGRLEDAARRAVALVETFGPQEDRVQLLLDVTGGGAGAAWAAPLLRRLVEEGGASEALRDRILDVWEATAHLAGRTDDVRDARLRRCRVRDEEDLWFGFLAVEAPKASVDLAASWLRPLLSRSALVRRLVAAAHPGLGPPLELLARTGDALLVSEALHAAAPTGSLPLELARAHAAALAELGDPLRAARALLGSVEAFGGAGTDVLRAARWLVESGDKAGAADALLSVPLSALDETLLALAREVGASLEGDGVLLLVRVAVATDDDADVSAALLAAQSAPVDVALAVAGWRLRAAPRDERAWDLVAFRAKGPVQEHFALALALRGLGPLPPSTSTEAQRMRELLERSLPEELLAAWGRIRPARSSLQRARAGAAAERRSAWRELATEAAMGGDDVGAARFLARAGVPLAQAAVEVRLAADPQLARGDRRAAALAEALASPEVAGDAERRQHLQEMFASLDAGGWTSAADRRRAGVSTSPLARHIDDADLGVPVHVSAVLGAVGKHPGPQARSTAAALLASAGHDQIAALLDPRVSLPPTARSGTNEMVAAALAAAVDEPLVAVGLLRQVAAMSGFDERREREIQDLAQRAGRTDLAAESLGRMAGAAPSTAERAALLKERALLRAGDEAFWVDAMQNAQAAALLAPTDEESARVWLELAELTRDRAPDGDRTLADALGAVARATDDLEERRELACRRARMLRSDLLDDAAALDALEEALHSLPGDGALLEERALALAGVGRALEAAETLVELAGRRGGRERARLLRAAAERLEEAGQPDVAVELLLRGAAEGDSASLIFAEDLARRLGSPVSLAAVLDLAWQQAPEASERRRIALERARILDGTLGQRAAALALLETQVRDDVADVDSWLLLAEWYVEAGRSLDAAVACEHVASLPGLSAEMSGAAAREAAGLLAAAGERERAGPLAAQAVRSGVVDSQALAIAADWLRAHGRWGELDAVLGVDLERSADATPRARASLWLERAEVRRRAGDNAGARKALHRAVELVPDDPDALQWMREDATRLDGGWGALRAALFRASELATERGAKLALLREIALLDADQFHDLKAAEATVDQALLLNPEDADCLVLKARILVGTGKLAGVSALVARAEQSGAKHLPGMLQLVRGDGLLLRGDRDGAWAAFFAATSDAETAPRAWDRLIDLAEGTPQFAEVLEQARVATSDPKRQLALLKRESRARWRAGDEDGGLACLEGVLRAEPGDAEAFQLVRDAYVRGRKLPALLPWMTAWARAAADEPTEHAKRLGELGAFLFDDLGDEPLARETFEEALIAKADWTPALLRLADIAWAARDEERALGLLESIAPSDWPGSAVELAYRKARCAWALGREDAQERLRAVLRLDAKHQDALDMLARLALSRGDDDVAEFALESLTAAISAREDPVRLSLAFLELAQLRGRQGRWQEALVAAERAFELDPASAAALDALATGREEAGRHLEAAEAWRRVSMTRDGPERIRALERRARNLCRGGKIPAGVDVFLDLQVETGESRYRDEAEIWARRTDDDTLLKRLGVNAPSLVGDGAMLIPEDLESTQTGTGAAGGGGLSGGFHALALQVRANLEENDPETALQLLEQAARVGALDREAMRLVLDVAERGGPPLRALSLADAYLRGASDPSDVKHVARRAAAVAEQRVGDLDRVAGLLYAAHQADAEDLEIRFDLTRVYARLPRLASHAVTGILQLLRRAPADARVFDLAAELATAQAQPERALMMLEVAALLRGEGTPRERRTFLDERIPLQAIDAETIQSRLAPTGWGAPLQALLGVVGSAAETIVGASAVPRGAGPIHERSPRAALALDRLERLLPGRPFHIFVGGVDRMVVLVGAAPSVVLPADVLDLGDAALLASVARAYGVVRLGAVMPEVLAHGEERILLEVLRDALVGSGNDPRSARVLERLSAEQLRVARSLAETVFAGPIDVGAAFGVLSRAVDRFALTVSGSLPAALHAGPLPSLLREPPAQAASLLRASPRALELCAFAARDNLWLVRRQQGLSR